MKKAKEIKSAGFCVIRKDLQKSNSRVPIGHAVLDIGSRVPIRSASYYSGSYPLSYRWLKKDEGFQVFYQNKWQDAESIDFDFLNTEKEIIVAHFKNHSYSDAIEEIKTEWSVKDLKEILRHCGYKTNYSKDILAYMLHDLVRIEGWNLKLTAHNVFLVK